MQVAHIVVQDAGPALALEHLVALVCNAVHDGLGREGAATDALHHAAEAVVRPAHRGENRLYILSNLHFAA